MKYNKRRRTKRLGSSSLHLETNWEDCELGAAGERTASQHLLRFPTQGRYVTICRLLFGPRKMGRLGGDAPLLPTRLAALARCRPGPRSIGLWKKMEKKLLRAERLAWSREFRGMVFGATLPDGRPRCLGESEPKGRSVDAGTSFIKSSAGDRTRRP
jgi:hypothetical protein